jgi:hypothetical protein
VPLPLALRQLDALLGNRHAFQFFYQEVVVGHLGMALVEADF